MDSRVVASRSRRAAWIVASVASGVAVCEALALVTLVPLKTVQPVTLLVDRQTGYVQALDPLQPRKVSADSVLTQSFLAQYVVAREGFDRAIAATDYRKVALWSADRARSAYLATMPATNPASPFQHYPTGTVVSVTVKSVSHLSQSTALVRFDTRRSDRNGGLGASEPWISVVRYRYVDAPMSLEDRLVNPLGFQVWSYRRDAEAAPAPQPQTQPAATSVSRPASINMAAASDSIVVRLEQPKPVSRRLEPYLAVRESSRREVPVNQLPLGSPVGVVTR